jgi:hypothetical protein
MAAKSRTRSHLRVIACDPSVVCQSLTKLKRRAGIVQCFDFLNRAEKLGLTLEEFEFLLREASRKNRFGSQLD